MESLPGSTTALRLQLATALRERDEAREHCRVYNCGGEPPCGKCITCQWDDTRESLAAANARADAQIAAILHTIGGMVEGHPTSAINYLQRLRALVAIEKAFADAGPMVASAKYMVEKARDCERAESALAAARRENGLLRERFEKVAEFHEEQLRLLDSEPAKEWAGSDKTGYYAAWKTAHTVAAYEAREALAAPAAAAGGEGT